MARDFIKVTTGSAATQAPALLDAINLMRQAIARLTQCRAVMTHNNDGTVFTDIETLFGVPAGQGQTLFNLVNGAFGSTQGTFQVADYQTMVDKVG